MERGEGWGVKKGREGGREGIYTCLPLPVKIEGPAAYLGGVKQQQLSRSCIYKCTNCKNGFRKILAFIDKNNNLQK